MNAFPSIHRLRLTGADCVDATWPSSTKSQQQLICLLKYLDALASYCMILVSVENHVELLGSYCQYKSRKSRGRQISVQLTQEERIKSYGRWESPSSQDVFSIEKKNNSDTKLEFIYYYYHTLAEDDDHAEAQDSKIMEILSYGNEIVEKTTINVCLYCVDHDITTYLKTILEHDSYASLRTLTMERGQLYDLDLLLSLPQHSPLSTALNIKFNKWIFW